jgi:hypothetical protein
MPIELKKMRDKSRAEQRSKFDLRPAFASADIPKVAASIMMALCHGA